MLASGVGGVVLAQSRNRPVAAEAAAGASTRNTVAAKDGEPGCPEIRFDLYSYRCGMGTTECHLHGPFEVMDATYNIASPEDLRRRAAEGDQRAVAEQARRTGLEIARAAA
jgi:hypothetical protein